MNARALLRVAGVAAVLLAVACTPPPWDLAGFEQRYRGVRGVENHRLGDVVPYLIPAHDQITFFFCRWLDDEPIPVSLPAVATAEQRNVLERALATWERAGLGVRFAPPAEKSRGIEIRFTETVGGAGVLQRASTIADCAVDAAALTDRESTVLPARLVFASIHMRGFETDAQGRQS